ncbi:MAG: glycosyl transferase family 1 [Bacteroidetes bacterium 46-16]|nr:MAG: glycosyl transferase family 1 [Bacteroidetes bacterium 46-16]
MKIAIIGPAHPLRGGLATYNARLAEVLQEHGHNVTIYSFSLQYPGFLFPGTSQFTDEAAPEGITIKTVINSVNPFNWIKAGRQIKRARPDLIIVRYWLPFMGPCLGTILRIVRGNKHSRIVCIADNVIPHEKRPGDKAFTKYFLKPVDAFITMSKDVLKDLKTLTGKPARFTVHPVYDNFEPPVNKAEACKKLGLDPGGKYILFFGFIRRYKGLDIVLKTMADERIQAAGIKLIVAGEFYDDRNFYEQVITEYKVQDHIHLFTEFIPNSEVRYYFSAADLVVQPYRDATQSGITQVAYHFEKPMVVTNVGGLAEVVPDGKVGFVAAPEPTAIADAVLHFFEPNSIPALQENILHEKRKYSWATFVEALMDISGIKS